jgi:hypothetical protein
MKLIQNLVQLLETKKQQSSHPRDEFYSSRSARGVFENDSSDLREGDLVKIIGNVVHSGETGTVKNFGFEKKFVIVKLKDGSLASFHSSNVTKIDDEEDDEDDDEDRVNEDVDDDDDDDDVNTFYVAFYEEEDGRSWIGKVTKEDGNKWYEKKYKGRPHYNWGSTYMGYLTPDQVMTWIHKDYDDDGVEIKGPFFDPEEAEEYVKDNWGNLK